MAYEGGGMERDGAWARRWAEAAAAAGNASAMNRMGMICHNAEGVERDPEAAAAWFEKAARLGDVEAQATLGAAYHMGLGVRQDQVLAYRWLARAQRRGNEVAAGFLLRVRPLLSDAEREMAERLIEAGDSA
jgi:uncharacterized protein